MFGIVESLLIANLSFVHCGTNVSKVVDLFAYIPQQNYSQYIVFASAFFLVEDLDLSGVLVQNSTGYGLGTLNLLGNSSITDSTFVFNKGNTFHPGGNALVFFMLNEQQCSLIPDKIASAEVNLAITSSKFMYGSTPEFATLFQVSPGLNILLYQQCSHVTIQINNSVMSGTKRMKRL